MTFRPLRAGNDQSALQPAPGLHLEKFLKRQQEKVLICDGAMGTMIQSYDLNADDFAGLEGCNEYLCITRPAIIKEIHAAYLDAGADVIETNSFGSSVVVLDEYGIGDRTYEIAKRSAELACQVAADYSTPRFVSGSVGPGTKLPTLGHITFDEMHRSYFPAMVGLLEGGIDLFQIETCQDLLQVKIAVICAADAMKKVGRQVPVCVTFTVETTGTMLVGSEVLAALTILEALPVHMVGLNCATGPDMMQENVRTICATSTRPVAVLPNAGLPRNVGGRAVYDLTPEMFADYHELFVRDFGIAMAGGCCGTTPQHIRALNERVGSLAPRARRATYPPHVSSTFQAVPLDQDGSSPLFVGERCNANGSKAFRELLLAENWEGIVEMGRSEAEEGSHVLDLCTAYVGRDEARDMSEVVRRFSSQITAPLMIDSTQVDVMETALKLIGGRPIINSINLEDGEEKFDHVCRLAARFGAALVALTIDEEGMAKSAERKLAVARRIFDLCTKRHGIPPEALLFDPLTFTIGSGDEDSRGAGVATLQGIEKIKRELPGVRTILGLSNISFGLKPYPRQILNSVFLAEALRHGLDACIVHARKILPLHQIAPELVSLCQDLIYDRRRDGYDPLFRFIEQLQGAKAAAESNDAEVGPIEDQLKRAIIDGKRSGIELKLDQALKTYPPLQIVNQILLEGMKTVGDLFASGEMQLPFVLQSAETMKRAVAYLEQFMERSSGPLKGCMVLATVKGDVHDIGKNLVDIILSNNGYKVVNLGIKQPIESILAAAEEHRPNAIGLSGLLVKSTLIMKENLEFMAKKGLSIPVICGGAALNRAYVEVDLRQSYKTGKVFYGADAFTGLQLMDEIAGHVQEPVLTTEVNEARVRRGEMRAEREARVAERSREYAASDIEPCVEIPTPPFWGARYVREDALDLKEIFPFINKRALFANQWQYRLGSMSTREYKDFLRTHVEPLFHQWCERAIERGWLTPRVAYGYFPCQSERNTLIVYSPARDGKELCRFEFPRQVAEKRRCISDFFARKDSGRMDVVSFHLVTVGSIASEMCQKLFQSNEYSDYLHFYGLSVETAEALAEYWHKHIRAELGISGEDGLTIDALQRQTYRGERYSFGYPACPNLEDQKLIFQLLKPEEIGMSLTSEFQLVPEQSTSAIITHHPQAAYFAI
ncbi:MAG: methionine synthase [Bdellovibrionota bacterium]|nr:MAG: methionine synthase [Bdellovibrionota bacterium]